MLSRERIWWDSMGTESDDRHPWNKQLPPERIIVRLRPVVTSGDVKKEGTLSVSKKKRGGDVRMAVEADGTGEVKDVLEYRVDRAFGPSSGDTEVYQAAVSRLVDRAIRGGNGLLLLAGTPRSDRCLTMCNPPAPPRTTLEGLLPSALADLTSRWRGGGQQSYPSRQRLAKTKTTPEAAPNVVMRLCVAEIWGGVDGGTRDLLKDSDASDCEGQEPDAPNPSRSGSSPKNAVVTSHGRRLGKGRSGAIITDGFLSPGGNVRERVGRDETADWDATTATPKGSAKTKTVTTALLTAGVLVGVTEATADGLDRALSLIGESQERRTRDRRGHLVIAVKLVVPTAAKELATTTRTATGELVFVEMADCPGGDLPRTLLAALENLKISKHAETKRDSTAEIPSDDPLRVLFGCLASGGLWVSPTRRSGRNLARTAGSPLEVSVMATLDNGSAFRAEKMAVLEALARSTRTRPKSCPSFKQILESIPIFACGSRALSVDAVCTSVTPPTALSSSKDSGRSFIRSAFSSASVSTCPLAVEAAQDDLDGNGNPNPQPRPHSGGSDRSSDSSVGAMEVVEVEGATERSVDCSVEEGGQDDAAVRDASDSTGLSEGHEAGSQGGLSVEGGVAVAVTTLRIAQTTGEAREGDRSDDGGRCTSSKLDGDEGVGIAVGRGGGEETARDSRDGAWTSARQLDCSDPEENGIEGLSNKERRETPTRDCGSPMRRLLLLPVDELAKKVLQAEEACSYWKNQHILAKQELAELRERLGPDKKGLGLGEVSRSPGSESDERVAAQADKLHRGVKLANAALRHRCASLPMEAVSGGFGTETAVTPSRMTFEERRALFCVNERRAPARSSVVARRLRSVSSVFPRESDVPLVVEGAGARKSYKRRSSLPNRATDCVVPGETKRVVVVPSVFRGENSAERVNMIDEHASGTEASVGQQTSSASSIVNPSENPAPSALPTTSGSESESESVSTAAGEASNATATTAAVTAVPRECPSAVIPPSHLSSGSARLLTAPPIPPVALTPNRMGGSSELPDLDSPCSSFFSPPFLSPPSFPKPISEGLAMGAGAETFERESSFRRPLSTWYGIPKGRDGSSMRPRSSDEEDGERRSRTWSVDRGANARRGIFSALRMASLSRSLSSEGSPSTSSGAVAAVSSAGAVAAVSSAGAVAVSSSEASSASSSPATSSVFYDGESRIPNDIMSPDSAAAATAAAAALEMTASLASGITTRECSEYFWGGGVSRQRESRDGSEEQIWKKSLKSFSFPKASSVPVPRASPATRNNGQI